MTDYVTIARPYAKAVFSVALSHQEISQWSALLQVATQVIQDKRFAALLLNPRVTREQTSALLINICAQLVNEKSRRFIELLAKRRRLIALPAIAKLYALYQEDYEKRLAVQVYSAFPLMDKAAEQLTKTLEARFHRQVTLDVKVHPSLIGGMVIRAGDIVIDGSVRGKLLRLTETLVH